MMRKIYRQTNTVKMIYEINAFILFNGCEGEGGNEKNIKLAKD